VFLAQFVRLCQDLAVPAHLLSAEQFGSQWWLIACVSSGQAVSAVPRREA
jgi:hypothetical protein